MYILCPPPAIAEPPLVLPIMYTILYWDRQSVSATITHTWVPSYSNQEIEAVLNECKLRYHESDDVCAEAAGLLKDGRIFPGT